jgi:hypothetical protein
LEKGGFRSFILLLVLPSIIKLSLKSGFHQWLSPLDLYNPCKPFQTGDKDSQKRQDSQAPTKAEEHEMKDLFLRGVEVKES